MSPVAGSTCRPTRSIWIFSNTTERTLFLRETTPAPRYRMIALLVDNQLPCRGSLRVPHPFDCKRLFAARRESALADFAPDKLLQFIRQGGGHLTGRLGCARPAYSGRILTNTVCKTLLVHETSRLSTTHGIRQELGSEVSKWRITLISSLRTIY